jgi:hypothetical protein
VLFTTVLEAMALTGVEEPRAKKWRAILENLAPFPTVEAGPEAIRNGRLMVGPFKGDKMPSRTLLASGYGKKEKALLMSLFVQNPEAVQADSLFEILGKLERGEIPTMPDPREITPYHGIFFCTELATVFPCGPISLANEGTDEFNAAINTVKLFAPAVMGVDPNPIVMARLGLGRETARSLKDYVDHWQFYCNGWGHYGPDSIQRAETAIQTAQVHVRDAALPPNEQYKDENRVSVWRWPFRHMGMESMSLLACAMNESLLQSHDGVVRVAPAVDTSQDARFTLHAAGGFVVSAEVRKGRLRWIAIRSLRGEVCTVANPWDRAYLFRNGKANGYATDKTIELKIRKGKTVLLAPSPAAIRSWTTVNLRYDKNTDAKTSTNGNAQLGLRRMF